MMNGYIITEEDIHCLFDYFQAALDGKENKKSLKRLFDQQCGVMRSHPYNLQNYNTEKYHPVTEEELDQIKNDCKYPLSAGCDGCECSRPDEPNPCIFIGANALMDEVIKRQYNPQAEQSCIWTEDEDGIYQTSCGNSFEFMNGTPNDNHTKFCPYCGKVLTQSKGGKP
jgi:hypothetical protein